MDFIRRLLEKDPANRITVDQALKHNFFHNQDAKQKKQTKASVAMTGGEEGQSKFMDYVSNPALAALKQAEQAEH